MPATKYWRGGAVHDGPPGIGIAVDRPAYEQQLDPDAGGKLSDIYNFAWYTSNCLKYIHATPAGSRMLAHLEGASIEIQYHPSHNMVNSNEQAALNLVAAEILGRGAPGPRTQRTAGRMWFAFLQEFRRQPLWDIAANPSARTPSDLRLTDEQLRDWIQKGRRPDGLTERQLQQLRLATISALDRWSPPGPGSPSVIGFCIARDGEYNRGRPPAIGLAHELVHAYFSSKGSRCGKAVFDAVRLALYEFKCVGLGAPWANAEISENVIRSQWASAHAIVPAADTANRQAVGRRMMYD